MAVHGMSARFLNNATQGNLFMDMYVSLTRFLTSSYAQSCGIERIAYNTGSAGTGENFVGEQLTVGNNAWSCYRFLSASTPFYMFLQATGLSNANNFGTAPGNPGMVDGSSAVSGVGVAFAMHSDGGNPWNGSVARSGSDFKRSPVWVTGSDGGVFVWPRTNSPGGFNSPNRENTIGIPGSQALVQTNPAFGCRLWAVCDEDHILFGSDYDSTGQVRPLFFGKYTPRPDLPEEIKLKFPYVCLRSGQSLDASFPTAQAYGFTTSGFLNVSYDGGVAHPYSILSGTRSVTIAAFSTFSTTTYQPSLLTTNSGSSATFDEFPLFIGLNESGMAGYLGYIDWIRYIWGPMTGDRNIAGNRVYMGSVTALTNRISVPWSPNHEFWGGVNREGFMF